MAKSYLSFQSSKSKDTIQTDRSVTSVASRGSALSRSGQYLKTPIRRFFFRLEVLKPGTSGIGNKRARADDEGTGYEPKMNPIVDTPPLSSDVATSPITEVDTPDRGPRTISHTRSPAQHDTPPVPCAALQNSDHSLDAVVISTLLKLPFCCHEDLLTMPPARVFEVAKEMNERLPEVLRIDVSEPRNHNDVRREVERLVGIVKKANEVPVPGAPLKRAKSRGRRDTGKDLSVDMLEELDLRAISPPTSPLAVISASRRRRRVGEADIAMITSPNRLAMLREEDENEVEHIEKEGGGNAEAGGVGSDTDDDDVFRAIKKRRTSDSSDENVEMITPTMRRIKVPLLLKKLYDSNNTSPTPHRILRVRSQRKVIFDDPPVDPSVKRDNVIIKTTVIDRSLVHTRARYRLAPKFVHPPSANRNGRISGPLQTSTPKIAQRRFEDRLFREDTITSTSPSREVSCPTATTTKDTSLDWSFGASRIPRYRRSKRGSRTAFTKVSDLIALDFDGRKDVDTNKTF